MFWEPPPAWGRPASIVVTGHGADEVEQATGAPGLAFVRQQPQLGTGHALQQAAPLLDDAGTTLVLNGDVPLIEIETLSGSSPPRARQARPAHRRARRAEGLRPHRPRATAATVAAIVEEKDACAEQRAIGEIYTGVMAAPTAR